MLFTENRMISVFSSFSCKRHIENIKKQISLYSFLRSVQSCTNKGHMISGQAWNKLHLTINMYNWFLFNWLIGSTGYHLIG